MQNHLHIILIGPMGSGKSTLGQALATQLHLPFFDVDHCIEADAGSSIPEIFASEGEAGFRQREAHVLANVLRQPPAVIATGGGAILAEENRQAMHAAGIVVYLTVDAETQLLRLAHDTQRPLLQTSNRAEKLAHLQQQRDPLYRAAAHFTFDTSQASSDVAVWQLVQAIRTYQADHA